jgi:hypothetical protein
MLRGFKNFLMQGDLIVIAVGLVVALAFSTLIQAFTDNIITPLVNAAGAGAAGEGPRLDDQRATHRPGRVHRRVDLLHHLPGRHLLPPRGAIPGLHATAGNDRIWRARSHKNLPGMQGIRSSDRRHSMQVLPHAAHRHRLNEIRTQT